MSELTRKKNNHSKKAEIVSYYYQWQNLKPSGKRKAMRGSHFLSKHQKGQRRNLL
jgi:hypothetical protein